MTPRHLRMPDGTELISHVPRPSARARQLAEEELAKCRRLLRPGQTLESPADDWAEVLIEPGPGSENASQEERNQALTDLFTGLTEAIRVHGCEVDLSDPSRIRVRGIRRPPGDPLLLPRS